MGDLRRDYTAYQNTNPAQRAGEMLKANNYSGIKTNIPVNNNNSRQTPVTQTTTVSSSAARPVATNTAPKPVIQQPVNNSNNSYNSWLNQMLQQRQNAYNNNKSAIDSSYGERRGQLDNTYESGKNALAQANTLAQEQLRQSKENAQRQAYIQSQEAERDMQQNLSAQGLSGGASESTLASMKNNYASNRNTNENQYLDSSSELSANYNSQLASMESQYQQLLDALNAERTQAYMQNENALTSGIDNYYGQLADYANALDYATYTNALNNASYAQQAELNDYYGRIAAERDLANKISYLQAQQQYYKGNNRGSSSNSESSFEDVVKEYMEQGFSREQAEAKATLRS